MKRLFAPLLIALSLALPAVHAQDRDGADLHARVDRGILPQAPPGLNWLPVRLVFAYQNVNYTARLEINPKSQNRAQQEMESFPWSKGGAQKIQKGLDLVVNQKATVAPLAEALRAAAPAGDRETLAAFALAFVQALPYKLDAETTPFDDSWRAPIQTLVDTQVDCEDSSILYAALLSDLGIESALVIVPNHMLTAVAGGFTGQSYEDGGRRYYYAETTGLGWTIGTLPPSVPRDEGLSLPIAAAGKSRDPVRVSTVGPQVPAPPSPAPPPVQAGADAARVEDDSALTPLLVLLLALLLGAGAWSLRGAFPGGSPRAGADEDPDANEYDRPHEQALGNADEPLHRDDGYQEIDYDRKPHEYQDFDGDSRYR